MIVWTHISWVETEIMYVCKMISSINRAHDCLNAIWNDPVCLVILSTYGSIYWDVEDYETENYMHVDIEHETEEQAAVSISTPKSGSRWNLGWLHIFLATMPEILCLPHACGKWYCVPCYDQLKLVPYIWELFVCGIFHFWGKFWVSRLLCRSAW